MARESGFVPKTRVRRILLVDDREDTCVAYATDAEAAGYRIELARDGYEALGKAIATRPDVVVTEAMLFGIDGFELALRMKRNPTTRGIPVVLLTGIVLPNLIERARDAGCVALLAKPCAFVELDRAILHALREEPASQMRRPA
jgi:CheY-like chemotaxis protein